MDKLTFSQLSSRMAGGSTPPAHETATAQTKPNSIIDDSDAVGVSSTPLADGNGASSGPDARPKRRQSKRRGSRRHSTEDEPPPESLGCNETHHKAVLVLREIRDHTAFTLFFILAILYSGVIVSNCPLSPRPAPAGKHLSCTRSKCCWSAGGRRIIR